MENCSLTEEGTALKLYENNMFDLRLLKLNPSKLFHMFSELQNEINFLKRENQELEKENIKLRNHFTFWYIVESIDSRILLGSAQNIIVQDLSNIKTMKLQIHSHNVFTQTTEYITTVDKTNADFTIRIEVAANANIEQSPQTPDVVKTFEINKSSFANQKKMILSQSERPELSLNDTDYTSDESDWPCTDSDKSLLNNNITIIENSVRNNRNQNIVREKPTKPPQTYFEKISNFLSSKTTLEEDNKLESLLVSPSSNLTSSKINYKEPSATMDSKCSPVHVCQVQKKNTLKNMFSRSKLHSTKILETVSPMTEKHFESYWSGNRRRADFPIQPKTDSHNDKIAPEEDASVPVKGIFFGCIKNNLGSTANNQNSDFSRMKRLYDTSKAQIPLNTRPSQLPKSKKYRTTE